MTIIRVAVLMTVHNRAATTERGLIALSKYAAALLNDFEFCVFLVDDGSTDDTRDRIRDIPIKLTVTQGTGTLYWNRGMVLAFEVARASRRSFDAYMLFNDDVVLNDNFIDYMYKFRELERSILVGAFLEPGTSVVSYSGFRRVHRYRPLSFHKPPLDDALTRVDTFNGNLVMVPGDVYESLGGLDPGYTHAYGDLDLGLRASELGVPSLVYGAPVGWCARGSSLEARLNAATFRDRWTLLFGYPHGMRSYLRFARKHCNPALLPLYAAHETLRRLAKLFRASATAS